MFHARVSLCLALALALGASRTVDGAEGPSVCLLRLTVDSSQSAWSGGGQTQAPTTAYITTNKLNATGTLFLAVPTNSSQCPPELTAANVVSTLERASLLMPIDGGSISFKPADLRSNITADPTDPSVAPMAVFDFYNLGFGYTGNEPLGPGAVTLGTGSPAEAKAAAATVCSQLVMLGGQLNLTSLLGPRTADVHDVSFNRTISIGASVRKNGNEVGDMALYISNATLFINISPEITPGVQLTKAQYMLSGDLVASADLADVASWEAVPAGDADWSKVAKLDAPVVIAEGEDRPRPRARIIGVNSTMRQECTPTRVLDAATGGFTTAPAEALAGGTVDGTATAVNAAGSSSSALRALTAGAAGALVAVLAL